MMNLLSLGLLASVLAAAGLFSPPPDPKTHHHHQQDTFLREGHRVIVVEYERELPVDDHHHPPQPQPPSADHHHLIQDAKDKFQEAASLLPNVGQGISTPPSTTTQESGAGVKEKICDAFGHCRDKISTLLGNGKDSVRKGKDTLSEKTSKLEEDAMDAIEKGKEKLSDKASRLKEGVMDAVDKTGEKISDLKDATGEYKDKLYDEASRLKGGATDAIDKTKEKLSDKASQFKEAAKQTTRTAVDTAREAGEGVAENTTDVAKKATTGNEEAAAGLRRNLTDISRRARDVAYDAAAYVGVREKARAAVAVVHLVAVAAAYGASIWVTFVSSHVLARALPRQQFGVVQSRMYPVYFRALTYCVASALLAHYFGGRRRTAAEGVQGWNLMAVLVMVVVNMLYLEPKATRVMFERMKMEKEEGRGRDLADVVLETPPPPAAANVAATATAAKAVRVDEEVVKSRLVKLSQRLKKLNSYSSLMNISALMGLTWHLVYLARCLQPNC